MEPLIRCTFESVAFIEVVEQAVEQVGQAVDDWPEARAVLDQYVSNFSNDELEKREQPIQEWTEEQAKAQELHKKRVTWTQAQLKQLEPK